ncbi:MAG: ABC transporter permease [Actinomycetota bacterium]|nr:ABC transporter permease [Actinomycetota bacterium]
MSLRYLIRRLAQLVPTVGLILVGTFLLIHLAPGDPILALAGQHGDAAYYAAMRHRFGLDQPLPRQLAIYLGNVLHGDLGASYVHGRSSLAVIVDRLPATLLLASSALVISSVVGIGLGVVAARRLHRPADLGVRVAALCGYATPSFWLAQLTVLTLAFGTGLFPVHGMTNPSGALSGWAQIVDVAHHLVLPAGVLAATEVALNTRLVRASLVEVSRMEFIRTARAKGLPEWGLLRHALRNALLPVMTVIGSRLGMFFAGAVLVEIVFAWPGLGTLLLSAAQARDYPVLLAIFLLVSVAVVLANLLTDLVYTLLDPRIRYE